MIRIYQLLLNLRVIKNNEKTRSLYSLSFFNKFRV
jgi:hypothetical protein